MIERDAFYGCTGLTSVTIPDSVKEIGWNAFKECTGLTSVTISDSIKKIGWSAFEGCTELTSIEIPDSVTEIGWNAFRGCWNLDNIFIKCSNGVISKGRAGYIRSMIENAKGNLEKVHFINANGEEIQPIDE